MELSLFSVETLETHLEPTFGSNLLRTAPFVGLGAMHVNLEN